MKKKSFFHFGILAIVILFLNPATTGALKIAAYKERIGPLRLNNMVFTIELMKRRILNGGEEVHFKETVESFKIIDNKRQIHYRKHLGAELGPYGFRDEWDIKGFVLKGKKGKGLILYYTVFPSAPGGGVRCQVFTLEKGKLLPMSLPITVYGEIEPLPKGSIVSSLQLFEEDTMRFKVWTGNFFVVVPLLVAWKERDIRPLKIEGEFDIEAEGSPIKEEGIVRLFTKPHPAAL